jgi:hypothetical protein
MSDNVEQIQQQTIFAGPVKVRGTGHATCLDFPRLFFYTRWYWLACYLLRYSWGMSRCTATLRLREALWTSGRCNTTGRRTLQPGSA